jgi:serine/threonine-protein kinase
MIGKQIGPYIIQEKLGEGGMGVVYKGIHKDIEQTVAIKVLYPQYAKDENFRERFKREAKVQAKLHHPNVVNILNYLEDEDGNMYIVMEYVGGGSLEDKMRTGKISLSDSVSVIIQVLNALSYMHSNGIIHRDIKPSNIMFADSIVKVSDFGIAKPMSDKGLTKTGAIVGTVWYMAPEIIKGEDPTPASDLYAVGVILYQLLTGRTPFYGKTDFEVMKSHLEKEPQPPETLNPNLPPGTWDLVKKALAKNPKERFSSADEFKQALIDWFSRVEDLQNKKRGFDKFTKLSGQQCKKGGYKQKVCTYRLALSSYNFPFSYSRSPSLPEKGKTQRCTRAFKDRYTTSATYTDISSKAGTSNNHLANRR